MPHTPNHLEGLFGPTQLGGQPTPNTGFIGRRGALEKQKMESAFGPRSVGPIDPSSFRNVGAPSAAVAPGGGSGPPIDPQQLPGSVGLGNILEFLESGLRQGKGAGLFPFFQEFGRRDVGQALREQLGAGRGGALQRIADIFLNRGPDAANRQSNFLSALFSSNPGFSLSLPGEGPANTDPRGGSPFDPTGNTGGTPVFPPGSGPGAATQPPRDPRPSGPIFSEDPAPGTGGQGGIGGIGIGGDRPTPTTFPGGAPDVAGRLEMLLGAGVPGDIRTMPLEQRIALREQILGPQVGLGPSIGGTLAELFGQR